MINKQIHYIWVGKKAMPKKIQYNIIQNKKMLGKDWKINIWTEKDFDINSNPFTKYWYSKRQWAFVSDYLRAYFVNKYGGFYFDTDIVLSKKLNSLLRYDYVASRTYIAFNTMSIFGSTKNHSILKEYMKIISAPKMIKKPPRIISTDIHAYAIRKFMEVPDEKDDYFYKKIAILGEDKLQIQVNKNNIAIHEHHDNWKGNSNLEISKYYDKKVKTFNNESNKLILKHLRKRNKIFKKIERLI